MILLTKILFILSEILVFVYVDDIKNKKKKKIKINKYFYKMRGFLPHRIKKIKSREEFFFSFNIYFFFSLFYFIYFNFYRHMNRLTKEKCLVNTHEIST